MPDPTPQKTCATCANGSPFLFCAYKYFVDLAIGNPDDTCPAYEPKQPKEGTQP